MNAHYENMLKEGRCWRAFRTCQYGRMFLRQLYSWDDTNPLDPWLVWKVCDPCEFEGVKMSIVALVNDGELALLGKAEAIEQFYVKMQLPYRMYMLSLGCT